LLWGMFIVAGIVILMSWSWQAWNYYYGPQSHQSSGVLKSVDGDKLIIFGSHINDNDINKAEDFSKRQDLTVVVGSETKFAKSVWYIPMTKEYLEENKIKLDLTKIKKEKLAGSIEDFKNVKGMPIIVKTKNNSINKSTLKATEIDYTIFVYAK